VKTRTRRIPPDQLGRSRTPFPLRLLALALFLATYGSACPARAGSVDPAPGTPAAAGQSPAGRVPPKTFVAFKPWHYRSVRTRPTPRRCEPPSPAWESDVA